MSRRLIYRTLGRLDGKVKGREQNTARGAGGNWCEKNLSAGCWAGGMEIDFDGLESSRLVL